MDRLMVYPGAIPLDTDVLSVERNVMKALGWLTQATFGTSTGVVGMPCNPTVPASMTVNVGPGAIWAQAQVDQMPFGSLPADASPLMKMGILPNAAGTSFTLTAPSVSGQSVTYLIEAAFEEADETPVVLPYVNPNNPVQPFTGPDNAGTPQNTVRAQLVDVQLKAGVAANTGTQVAPNVDAGYVGLYLITVNYGQTAITGPDIAEYGNAPFVGGPYAPIAGNANQPFSVAPAELNNQAVQLGQFQYVYYAGASSVNTNYASTEVSFEAPFDCLIFTNFNGANDSFQGSSAGEKPVTSINFYNTNGSMLFNMPNFGAALGVGAAVCEAKAGTQITLTWAIGGASVSNYSAAMIAYLIPIQ